MLKLQKGKLDQRYALTGLFLIFVMILFVSIAQINFAPSGKLYSYDPTVFSLFSYMPPLLWVGLFGIVFLFLYVFIVNPSSLSSKFTNFYILILMFAILLVVFGLPYIVEHNPRFVDSWVHGATAENVLETGRLNPQEFPYQYYPLSFIVVSTLSLFLGLDLAVVLTFLPPILAMLFFASLTIFFKSIIKSFRLAVASVLIFALSTFYLSFHFSPEVFGWIFFFLLFAFIAKNIKWRKSGRSIPKSNVIVVMVLTVAITLTHPVTQFLTLLILLTLGLVGAWIWKFKFVSVNILVFAIVVIFSWTLYSAPHYFQVIINSFETAVKNNLVDYSSSILVRNLSESSPSAVANFLLFRRALYLLVPLAAIYGIFYFFKKNKPILVFFLTWLSVALLTLPLTVFGLLPLERPVKMAFISLSFFSGCLVVQKKKLGSLLLIFILVTIPVNFISMYWNEASTMTHDWEINASQFITGDFNGTVLSEFKETGIMWFYGSNSTLFNDYSAYGIRPDVFNTTFIQENNIELIYITQLTVLRYSQFGINIDLNEFSNSSNFDCVYSNGYSSAFLR